MIGKLRLQAKDELIGVIERVVFFLTTLPKEFMPFYLQFELLQDGFETAEELPLYSADLEEEYK
jgi:hypothetical protein